MLCEICHKNVATVHLTEIVNEKVMEMHLCQKCARVRTEELKHQLSLSDFLSGLVEKRADEVKKPFACALCGLTFYDFKKKGRLGCSKCYETFKEQLLPLLRKIHGSVRHVGKRPHAAEENIFVMEKIKELKNSLERAVKLEEYEEAARMRDTIRELEKKKSEK